MPINVRSQSGTSERAGSVSGQPLEEAEWRGHKGVKLEAGSSEHQNCDVIDCTTCGFAHVVPLPSAEDLEALYAEDFYDSEKPDYLDKARADEEWAALFTRDKLDTFSHLLGKKERALLDIGSGPGMFLKAAADAGWTATGVEPSRQAVAHTRDMGLEVVEGFFDEAVAKDLGTFNVVHLNNMLEHVPDPADLLARAASLVKPGGLLCVTVPNDYNGFQTAVQINEAVDPWWVAPDHHLNYFNFESLARLLSRVGFEEERRLTSFPMEAFLLMGENYIDDPKVGSAAHAKRVAFDLGLEKSGQGHVRRAFYQALASAGLGREASIIARKSETI